MKEITYKIEQSDGLFVEVSRPYSQANLAYAAAEAYGGKYTVTDVTDESAASYLEPGVYHVFGVVDELTIRLPEVDELNAFEYAFEFIPSESFAGLVITPEVRWTVEPIFFAGKTHQVSILRGVGVMISV